MFKSIFSIITQKLEKVNMQIVNFDKIIKKIIQYLEKIRHMDYNILKSRMSPAFCGKQKAQPH